MKIESYCCGFNDLRVSGGSAAIYTNVSILLAPFAPMCLAIFFSPLYHMPLLCHIGPHCVAMAAYLEFDAVTRNEEVGVMWNGSAINRKSA